MRFPCCISKKAHAIAVTCRRHCGGASTPPRWRESVTAVTVYYATILQGKRIINLLDVACKFLSDNQPFVSHRIHGIHRARIVLVRLSPPLCVQGFYIFTIEMIGYPKLNLYLYGLAMKILALVAKSSTKLDFSLAYSYLCAIFRNVVNVWVK